MRDTALSRAALELTQKIQMHFPSDIDSAVVQAWNGCPVATLTEQLRAAFGHNPNSPNPVVEVKAPANPKTILLPGDTHFLRLISAGENPVIPATDGKKTVAQAKDVFNGRIDPDFKGWGTDVVGEAAPEIVSSVYEMTKDSDFQGLFSSFGVDSDKLCLSQEQIIAFVKKNRKWLRTEGYGTFFLFKVGDEFFVARLDFGDRDLLDAGVYRLSGGRVWDAEFRHRVVVPQQTL